MYDWGAAGKALLNIRQTPLWCKKSQTLKEIDLERRHSLVARALDCSRLCHWPAAWTWASYCTSVPQFPLTYFVCLLYLDCKLFVAGSVPYYVQCLAQSPLAPTILPGVSKCWVPRQLFALKNYDTSFNDRSTWLVGKVSLYHYLRE